MARSPTAHRRLGSQGAIAKSEDCSLEAGGDWGAQWRDNSPFSPEAVAACARQGGGGVGRRRGRGDYRGATRDAQGPGASAVPTRDRKKTMTTGTFPRSNKKERLLSPPRSSALPAACREAPSGHPTQKSPAATCPRL